MSTRMAPCHRITHQCKGKRIKYAGMRLHKVDDERRAARIKAQESPEIPREGEDGILEEGCGTEVEETHVERREMQSR